MAGNALISEGVKDILTAASVGVFQPYATENDWNIVISRMRDKPNKMIAIYDTAGFAPEPGLDINYPSIQIVVRGEPDGYVDAHAKARRIRDALLGLPGTVINGDVWASVTMVTDIVSIGYDTSERPEFSMNFNLIVHQGDLTNSYREDSGTGVPGGGIPPPGGGTGGTGSGVTTGLWTVTAASSISGHKAVSYNTSNQIEHASNSSLQDLYSIIGVSTNAASPGGEVVVQTYGYVQHISWNWNVGLPVFSTANGDLTQSIGTAMFIRQIALAVSPTIIFVNPQAVIQLAS